MDHINVEGITSAGELETRLMRPVIVEEDYRNSRIAGQVAALTEASQWIAERLAAAGPYEDIRALQDFQTWAADRIRAIQTTDPEEAGNGATTNQ